MADAKITDLTADTSPTTDDLIVTVNDPAGTPANKKVTIGAISPFFGTQTATVATSETTTSTSYVQLTTTTDAVTVTIGGNGMAIVIITCTMNDGNANVASWMAFDISGASTVSATDNYGVRYNIPTGGGASRYSGVFVVTGLSTGSTTFGARYRVASGTGTFVARQISVIPL